MFLACTYLGCSNPHFKFTQGQMRSATQSGEAEVSYTTPPTFPFLSFDALVHLTSYIHETVTICWETLVLSPETDTSNILWVSSISQHPGRTYCGQRKLYKTSPMPTVQSETLISLLFTAFLLDPFCFTICKEIPPRKKTRCCTPPSFLPCVNFYSCFGTPCVTLLQMSCSVMKRKLEEKWWWAGRGYLGRPHE